MGVLINILISVVYQCNFNVVVQSLQIAEKEGAEKEKVKNCLLKDFDFVRHYLS